MLSDTSAEDRMTPARQIHLFCTISEILVLREYQKQGIGRELMRRAIDISPTSLFFGAQPEAEGFYEKLNIEKSLQSFYVSKTGKG